MSRVLSSFPVCMSHSYHMSPQIRLLQMEVHQSFGFLTRYPTLLLLSRSLRTRFLAEQKDVQLLLSRKTRYIETRNDCTSPARVFAWKCKCRYFTFLQIDWSSELRYYHYHLLRILPLSLTCILGSRDCGLQWMSKSMDALAA